ncbi:MAG: GDCCVxC domain-containing (seleno)protein [Gemmatimonadota bacterium]
MDGSGGLVGVITCPSCGSAAHLAIPTDACLWQWDCPACRARVRPKPGDCCVFCSYGDRRCPSAASPE